jgi:ABC-type branched-subunit amino acid transport system substrate-binding protein
MESLVRTGDRDLSPKLLAIYVKKFPQSAYLPRLCYLDGIVCSRLGQYTDALSSFSRALGAGLQPGLDSLVGPSVQLVCDKGLSLADLTSVVRRDGLHPLVRELAGYTLVARLSLDGQSARAERAAHDFLATFPTSRYAAFAQEVLGRGHGQRRDAVNVGLLAPLSGYDADIGKRILQGAQLAVNAANAKGGAQVNLVIRDTRSSMVQAARITYELVSGEQVPIILGPVLSPEAVAAAAILVGRDAVMITPTATDDGIAELGPNVFQMNVTTGVLGRTIADYAMANLNTKEFAILAPISDYGRALCESFRDEVRKGGGTIVAEQSFNEGANDFRPQFDSLRHALFRLKQSRDSVLVQQGALARSHTHREDSLCFADSALPVGGLFIPAECEDVVMLAPQVYFFKIRTQMLGATGWHNTKTILDGQRYVENAVFVTSAELERTDSLWLQFRTEYRTRFAAEPDRVSALGYDAARLICDIVIAAGGDVTAEQVSRALRGVQGYRGASGLISFDPARNVNREAVVLKILDRRFIRVH